MREFEFFDRDRDGYRKRLRLLRKMKGMNQQQFADFLEIPFKRWNHYERGYPIPRETAFLLMEKIKGLDPMWIWFGWNYARHLDEDLRSELRRLYNEEIALGAAKSGEVERTRTVRKTPRRIKATDKAPAKKK